MGPPLGNADAGNTGNALRGNDGYDRLPAGLEWGEGENQNAKYR